MWFSTYNLHIHKEHVTWFFGCKNPPDVIDDTINPLRMNQYYSSRHTDQKLPIWHQRRVERFGAITHCCVCHWPRGRVSVSWWTGCRRCRTGGSPSQTCGPPPAGPRAPCTSEWTISPAWPGRSDPGAHPPLITKLTEPVKMRRHTKTIPDPSIRGLPNNNTHIWLQRKGPECSVIHWWHVALHTYLHPAFGFNQYKHVMTLQQEPSCT